MNSSLLFMLYLNKASDQFENCIKLRLIFSLFYKCVLARQKINVKPVLSNKIYDKVIIFQVREYQIIQCAFVMISIAFICIGFCWLSKSNRDREYKRIYFFGFRSQICFPYFLRREKLFYLEISRRTNYRQTRQNIQYYSDSRKTSIRQVKIHDEHNVLRDHKETKTQI